MSEYSSTIQIDTRNHDIGYLNRITCGDCVQLMSELPDESVDCVVTSPPYWALRNYDCPPKIWGGDRGCEHDWNAAVRKWHSDRGNGERKEIWDDSFQANGTQHAFCGKCGAWRGQLGLEPTFNLYVDHLIEIFTEVKRVLKKSGTVWVNIADSYSTQSGQSRGKDYRDHGECVQNVGMGEVLLKSNELPPKSLCGIPERFALAMTDRLGFIRRNSIIWHKPNCMPSSARDRFTVDFEYIYFFTKSPKYWLEQQFEPHVWAGKDKRSQRHWTENTPNSDTKVSTKQYSMQHVSYGKMGRNKRCVWRITTKPSSVKHFAMYPEELIEIPIKAGCPEFVCNECGKPRSKIYKDTGHDMTQGGYGSATAEHIGVSSTSAILTKKVKEKKFAGYTDCACNAGFHPGTVLDPFVGTGTTAIVARRQNKNFIAFDISKDYAKIAHKRLADTEDLLSVAAGLTSHNAGY